MIQRNTLQCSLVYQTVNDLKSHATADEIYEKIVKQYPNISRGTVYRNLNRLCEMGKILRVVTGQGPDHFDHLCHKHYHVQCVRCSKVFDVDMSYIDNLEKNIKDTHGFELINHDIIFKGICPECISKK